MMQTTFNKPYRGAVLLTLVMGGFVLFAPTHASAFSLPSLPSFFNQRSATPSLTGVCLRVGVLEGTITTRVKAATAHYDKKADERLARTATKLSVTNSSNVVRTETDAKLSSYFKTLEAKATTAQQKQAVNDFKVRVVKASDVRREHIDAAGDAYAEGVTALYRGRIETVRRLGETMKTELTAKLAELSARCQTGADPSVLRAEIETALAGIERAYGQKFADRSELEAGLSALSVVRTEAIKQANRAFSAELDASSQSLRAVLQ